MIIILTEKDFGASAAELPANERRIDQVKYDVGTSLHKINKYVEGIFICYEGDEDCKINPERVEEIVSDEMIFQLIKTHI